MKSIIVFLAIAMSLFLFAYSDNSSSSNNATELSSPRADVETPEVVVKGQKVFEQKCASCHGTDGTAGIGNAANLATSKMDNISIVKIISEGKGAMPPFNQQLTNEEITDLSQYVVTMHK